MAALYRTTLWLGFFSIILVSWALMFMHAQMMGLDWIGRPSPVHMRVEMSMAMDMRTSGFGTLFGMWAVMMAAMMLPTMVPSLRAYEDLMTSAGATRLGWLGLLTGYLIAWVGFAALITLAQMVLSATGLVNHLGVAELWLGSLLFVAVGLFQFTRAKEICHGVCHSPTAYFLGHWRPGARGGVHMGLGLGVYCVGCCWGFMALGFVGGVMSLLWMGLATLFMVVEKLPQIGHFVTKPMGAILVLAGLGLPFWGG